MKRQILFGIAYGVLWFSIISLIFHFEYGFPVLDWMKMRMDEGVYPVETLMIGVRVLWAIEFVLHVLLAAMPIGFLITKYYKSASRVDLLKISTICIIVMGIFIFTAIPRYIPLYIVLAVQISSFILCLFGSVWFSKYITRRLRTDC